MISTQERALIVEELNKKINIPYVPERLEAVILNQVIRMSVAALNRALPGEIKELLRTEEGLTVGEHLDQLKDRFADYINKEIDIPWITEDIEQKIIDALCSLLVGAMVENTNLKLFLEYGGPVPITGEVEEVEPEGVVVETMTAEPPHLEGGDLSEPAINPDEEVENTISEESIDSSIEDPDTMKDSIE